MVFLHIVRSLQFYLHGRFAHAFLKAEEATRLRIAAPTTSTTATGEEIPTPPFLQNCLCLSRDVTVPVYIGLRLIDGFGHMNNASYLEVFEFGRWYHFSFTRFDQRMWHAALYPVVVGVNIQYLREIKPFQSVNCRIRGPFKADDKTMVMLQQLESKDGKTIYATATIQVVALPLPFKKPSTREAAKLAITKKGTIPIEEFMNRLYFSETERLASAVFTRDDHGTSAAAENSNASNTGALDERSAFGVDAVRRVTEASIAWRADAIQRAKAVRAMLSA